MKRLVLLATVLAFGQYSLPNNCFGDLILDTIDRSVFASVTVCDTTTQSMNNATAGVFMETVSVSDTDAAPDCQGTALATAAQNTNVTINGFTGSGSTNASYDTGAGIAMAQSYMNIEFSSVHQFSYDLTGMITGGSSDMAGDYLADISVVLSQGAMTIHSFMPGSPYSPVSFFESGTLSGGSYSLVIASDSEVFINRVMNSNYSFSFTTTPVPEPASTLILLFGLGLVSQRRHA